MGSPGVAVGDDGAGAPACERNGDTTLFVTLLGEEWGGSDAVSVMSVEGRKPYGFVVVVALEAGARRVSAPWVCDLVGENVPPVLVGTVLLIRIFPEE